MLIQNWALSSSFGSKPICSVPEPIWSWFRLSSVKLEGNKNIVKYRSDEDQFDFMRTSLVAENLAYFCHNLE